jgi:endonuclease IV
MASPASPHLVGFHCSAAKGIWNAVLNAKCCNATSFAFFTRTSRSWTAPVLPVADATRFKLLAAEHGFDLHRSVMPHGTYLSNSATADAEVRNKSIAALVDEAERCRALGLLLYNFHPGSRPKGGDLAAALSNVAAAINEVHARVADVVMVCLRPSLILSYTLPMLACLIHSPPPRLAGYRNDGRARWAGWLVAMASALNGPGH